MSLQSIALSKLRESPTNPRKMFGDLTELADSISAQGVLQPLVARKVDGELELVFGHRRLRAAKQAGLKEVPVIVRDMTDVEVLEAQLAENLARADVHPLELCDGYERLMRVGKLTGDQVAERLGISRSSVFTTLKLRDLVPDARKAFLAGRVASTAAAVAGVEAEQKRAGGALPIRAVQRLVQSRFMGSRSKTEQRRAAARPATSDAAYLARAHQLLLTRIGEVVDKKTQLDDDVLRLLLVAIGGERVASQGRLTNLRSARLRSLLVEAVLEPWLATEGAAKTAARVFGVSWAETEKTARQLLDAESLMAGG
jgi:ParB family chromosome partitioning protein